MRRAIPACAGRTPISTRPGPSLPGHPRVCGENDVAVGDVAAALRAIPACAGRTRWRDLTSRLIHGPSPRVRGEPMAPGPGPPPRPGHPRVCGENWFHPVPMPPVGRAIPACAGRTLQPTTNALMASGPSPRVRGELYAREGVVQALFGPSPRVRGERESDAPGWQW